MGLVTEKEKADTVKKQHLSFKQKLHNLPDNIKADKGIQAVIHFLDTANFSAITASEHWETLYKKKPNITFQLASETTTIIVNRTLIHQYVTESVKKVDKNAIQGACLITGETHVIARTHPKIKGVYGAQTSGAALVSFNNTAYTSFNKKQNYNAPIGEYAAFAYTTALDYLLKKGSNHKLPLGNITLVFWVEKTHPIKNIFSHFFSTSDDVKDTPQDLDSIKTLFSTPYNGVKPMFDNKTQFYSLGLSPNASRLSIRFWHHATVKEMAENILTYFNEVEIVMPPNWPTYPRLKQILFSMASFRKVENLSEQLSGAFIQAILNGKKYPQAALQKALAQDHLESKTENQTYPYRVSLIKAILIRNYGINTHCTTQQELTMSLNEEISDIAYRLGRLFCELEQAQKEAHKPRKIKRTIRESYYTAASTFPQQFPMARKIQHNQQLNMDVSVLFYN